MTGTDHTGKWTPAQYVIDAGWDYGCIEDTATKGIADADAEILTSDQQRMLVSFCKYEVSDVRGRVNAHAIVQMLKATGGNKLQAAKRLSISRQTLYNRIKEYGLS